MTDEAIGNAVHPHPKALVFCLCCGIAVEGNGYQVQYAPSCPPDVFHSKECHDHHIAARCGCFGQQVRR